MDSPIIAKLKQSKAFYKGGQTPKKVPEYYQHITRAVENDGLWLDFCIGKATAVTQHIISTSPDDTTIYGFDWFRGLPEEWAVSETEIYAEGTFAVAKDKDRVGDVVHTLEKRHPKLRVVPGLIQDTLPDFLEGHSDDCAFIHFDCDLYSSTAFALNALQERLVSGTVIAFDEFWNFQFCEDCEYKAFMEYIHENYDYEFIAHVANKRQAAIKIL